MWSVEGNLTLQAFNVKLSSGGTLQPSSLGVLQRSLIHEFQVAINEGTLFIWMLQQALLYARGLAPPNHPAPSDLFPPLNPAEAQQRSQRMLDEITCHCDILGCLMQEYSGETMAHDARVRAHMARMEHSPSDKSVLG